MLGALEGVMAQCSILKLVHIRGYRRGLLILLNTLLLLLVHKYQRAKGRKSSQDNEYRRLGGVVSLKTFIQCILRVSSRFVFKPMSFQKCSA